MRCRERGGRPAGLGPQVEGYRAWLVQRGYTPSTVRNMLKDLGQVGRWLTVQDLEAQQLDEERIAAFISARRAAGYRRVPGIRAMVPLLSYLREVGVVAEAPPLATPLEFCSSSTDPGWSTNAAWLPVRCCVTRTPHAAS